MLRPSHLLFWRRHERWRRDLSAATDDELASPELVRLRLHLASCERCRAYEGELRTIREAISRLPEIEAPRSFRLTPAMLAAPRTAAPQPPARVAFRGAQLATALAAMALVTVAVIDFQDGGSKRASSSTSSLAAAAPESAKSAPNAGAASVPGFGTQDSVAPAAATPAPSASAGVAVPAPHGASSAGGPCDGVQPLPPSPASAPQTVGPTIPNCTPQPAPASKATAQAPTATPPPDRANANNSTTGEPAAAPAAGGASAALTSRASWYRPAEVALGIVAVAGALAVLGLALHTGRRP